MRYTFFCVMLDLVPELRIKNDQEWYFGVIFIDIIVSQLFTFLVKIRQCIVPRGLHVRFIISLSLPYVNYNINNPIHFQNKHNYCEFQFNFIYIVYSKPLLKHLFPFCVDGFGNLNHNKYLYFYIYLNTSLGFIFENVCHFYLSGLLRWNLFFAS